MKNQNFTQAQKSIVLDIKYGKIIIKNSEWWKKHVGEIDPENPNRTFNGFIMLKAVNACMFAEDRVAEALGGRTFSFAIDKEKEEKQAE